MKGKQQGLTLIEIMVALAIFALVALAASVGLHSVLTSLQQTKKNAQNLRSLQYTMSLLQQDLSQAMPLGSKQSVSTAAFYRLKSQNGFTFIRGGNINPDGREKRSQLLRISYILTQHQLYRVVALWGAQNNYGGKQLLLTGVKQIHWLFVDAKGHRFSYWPANGYDQDLPVAVIMNLDLGKKGQLHRVFYLPGGRHD